MNEHEKLILIQAADLLRVKSRPYYDQYQRDKYSAGRTDRERATQAFMKYKEMTKIATDLDVLALVESEVK